MKKTKLLLILLLLFHFLNIIFWLNSGCMPGGKDFGLHLGNLVSINNNGLPFILELTAPRPPLFYLVPLILTKISQLPYKYIFLAPGLFFLLLLFFIYKIGVKLFDEQTGVLSAILCSFFPLAYSSSIQFNLEMATATMACIIFYCLIRDNIFVNARSAVLFALSLGLGLLTREFVILFLLAPITLVFADFNANKKVKKTKADKKDVAKYLLIIIIFIAICFIFYSRKGVFVSIFRRLFTQGAFIESSSSVFNYLAYYIIKLPGQIGLASTCLFVYSILLALKNYNSKLKLLFSWIAFPLFIISIIPLKESEYTLSFLPAISLVIASQITSIRNKKIMKLLVFGLITITMANYFHDF